jgi:predicted extracellular nuclease
MERFYNDKADADNPGSSVVVVTPEAYQRRLAKGSLAIRNVLNFPDILGVQEIENLAVLTDLAAKISSDATAAGQADPLYQPYLFLANDGTGINTGFLVKSTRVTTGKAEQLGLTTTFTNAGGNPAILNDRTPLVLHAGIKRGGSAPDYPVTVISAHQRSLINVDDPTNTGATVRLKREAQAEYLASLIQTYQAAGEHVVTVGDYNSFEFSDGFVDVLGVTRGDPVPASQVITAPTAGLANPALVDLVTLLPAAERQSYVENGSAQVLDHVVVTSDLVPTNTRLVYAHIDSDFPLVYQNDGTRPERVSDHDPAVAYFTIPPVAGTVQLATTATLRKVAGGYQATVTVKNSGTGTAQNVQLTGATLGSVNGTPVARSLGDLAPGGGTAVVTVSYTTAAASGTAAVEKYTGSYVGGTFGGSFRATLP